MEKPQQNEMRNKDFRYHHYVAALFWELQRQDRNNEWALDMKNRKVLFPANVIIYKHLMIIDQSNVWVVGGLSGCKWK